MKIDDLIRVLQEASTARTIEKQLLADGAIKTLTEAAEGITGGQFRTDADAQYAAGLLLVKAGVEMAYKGTTGQMDEAGLLAGTGERVEMAKAAAVLLVRDMLKSRLDTALSDLAKEQGLV